jgi:hypothetical protein
MKKKLALVLLVAATAAVFHLQNWYYRMREKRNERICVHQMMMWDAAAESYCLETGRGPFETLDMKQMGTYMKSNVDTCPSGKQPYAPFTVAYGPVCPNGHPFLPNLRRPFRAKPGEKLAVIYRYSGWTNLIDRAEQ